jgi:S1-C subfamily serine protease
MFDSVRLTPAARGGTQRDTSLGLFAEGFVASAGSTPSTAALRLRARAENPGARSRAGFHHGLLLSFALLALGCERPLGESGPEPRSNGPSQSERQPQPELGRAAEPLLPQRVEPKPPPPVQPPSPGAGIEDERNTIAVFEAAGPATVFVTQSHAVRNRFTARIDQIPAGSGSGFIWDTDGHIVTNFHVVAQGESFSITLDDGKLYQARLVGGDPKRDIAVLKIEGKDRELIPVLLPPPERPLVVGQKALAIGNPFGLDHSLTVGVISALDREVVGFGGVTIRDMIQTDASINPGNSGGPLLDSAGRLIGMNTMIFSKSGSSAGIGFAVPVSTIRRLVPQIIQFGAPRRAALGIEIVGDNIARRAGIEGVAIREVQSGGPAAKAGLHGLRIEDDQVVLGDVIVGIDDHSVHDYDDLFNALDHFEPGDEVKVKVRRAGEVFEIPLELAVLGP